MESVLRSFSSSTGLLSSNVTSSWDEAKCWSRPFALCTGEIADGSRSFAGLLVIDDIDLNGFSAAIAASDVREHALDRFRAPEESGRCAP